MYVKQIILLLIAFLTQNLVFCQVNQYWPSGYKVALVFKDQAVSVDTQSEINNLEGNSAIHINDSSYFYSDGISIYNKFHRKLNLSEFKSYISSTQGSIMLMHPDNDSIIFFITNDAVGNTNCPSYYNELLIINDTSLKLKKELLLNELGSEKVSAVCHKNGKDIWIISHSYYGNEYYSYLIKKNGIINCKQSCLIGSDYFNFKYPAQGQIKYSPSGNLVGCASIGSQGLDIFKYDIENGILYDSVHIDRIYTYGLEFSLNEKYLYVTSHVSKGILYQYDLSIWDGDSIMASEKLLSNKGNKSISALQMALNGRIYWSNNDSFYLAAIENPNRKADSCKVNFRSIFLDGRKASFGLPSVNQSYFYTPSIDYKYELNCISNNIKFWGKDTFKATTYNWQIKKFGKTAEANYTLKNITHTFLDTGKYQVRYIASNGNRHDTVIKTITLYPIVNKHFLGNDTMNAQGTLISRVLKAPLGMHCQLWQDGSGLSTYTAGVYTCKITNQSFCEITDTIVISSCNNSLTTPSIYRNRDTLYTYQTQADSFVWFRNNVQYRITKSPFMPITDTGVYRVEAAKKGYCNKSSNTYNVNKLGILTYQLIDYNIQLFPNPSSEQIFIKAENQFILQISDITGKIITVQKNIKSISLPKGIYFFNFNINEHLITEKVVIY